MTAETLAVQSIFDEMIRDRSGLKSEIEARLKACRSLSAVVNVACRRAISPKFEKATQNQELSPRVSQFVAAAAQRVKAGHDRIRDLRHALHGKS